MARVYTCRLRTRKFKLNAAVMGFGQNLWFGEALVASKQCLQRGPFGPPPGEVRCACAAHLPRGEGKHFGQYKSCVLASLRTQLPMDWSTYHVVA